MYLKQFKNHSQVKKYLQSQHINFQQIKKFYDENKDYDGDDMRIKCIVKMYDDYKETDDIETLHRVL